MLLLLLLHELVICLLLLLWCLRRRRMIDILIVLCGSCSGGGGRWCQLSTIGCRCRWSTSNRSGLLSHGATLGFRFGFSRSWRRACGATLGSSSFLGLGLLRRGTGCFIRLRSRGGGMSILSLRGQQLGCGLVGAFFQRCT